ncbi:MAG: hypothetical protein QXJ15_00415 [Candidatus Bathyarchaeia archaeon]
MLRERLSEILARSSAEDLLPGLEALLRGLIEEYGPESIIIAGSLPKSRFVRGLSDLDILVIVAREVGKHERFKLRAVGDVDAEISVYSAGEVLRALEAGDRFILDAIESGEEVYGDWRAHAMRRPKEAREARS